MSVTLRKRLQPLPMMMVLLTAMVGLPAQAADDKKAGKEKELARRVQQLQQEKTDLGAKLKEAAGQAEDSAKLADRYRHDADGKGRELAAARKAQAELTAKLEKLDADYRGLQGRLDETTAALGRREKEKRLLENTGAEQVGIIGRQSRLLDTCRESNDQLHAHGRELLDKLRQTEKARIEPLIGMGDVDSFNARQDYRDKLDRLRLDPVKLTP